MAVADYSSRYLSIFRYLPIESLDLVVNFSIVLGIACIQPTKLAIRETSCIPILRYSRCPSLTASLPNDWKDNGWSLRSSLDHSELASEHRTVRGTRNSSLCERIRDDHPPSHSHARSFVFGYLRPRSAAQPSLKTHGMTGERPAKRARSNTTKSGHMSAVIDEKR
jgi:hypothetical protein